MKETLRGLERELAKAEMKIEEALEAQAEAEYAYESWQKERLNILKALASFDNNKTEVSK